MDVAGYALTVLIVEKCHDTATTTAQLLEFDGHIVHIAYSAEEAYDLADMTPPDVVLMDFSLPNTDGCEIARRLNIVRQCKPPIIIVISGSTAERDKKRMFDAGCHLYLVKPVEPAILCGLMRRFSHALQTMESMAV